jgi:SAM-dependent methyltransferase
MGNPESNPQDVLSKLTPEQREFIEELADRIRYFPDFISKETYESIFDRIHISGKTMLDLGAGFVHDGSEFPSQYSRALDDRGVSLVPLDKDSLSARSWGLLSENQESPEDGIAKPVQGDVFQLPFKDGKFDAAISVNIINLMHDRRSAHAFLSEACRVLKSGSSLIISSFGYSEARKAGELVYTDQAPIEEPLRVSDIKKEAINAGFAEVVDIPLDKKRINQALERFRIFLEEKGISFDSVDMAERAGLILNKPK